MAVITTGTEKLFMVQAELTYKISLPIPIKDASLARKAKLRNAKFHEYLLEIREVEDILDHLDVYDEDFYAVKENIFYRNLAHSSYNMLFDGQYVKLVELNAKPKKWCIWCKCVSTI